MRIPTPGKTTRERLSEYRQQLIECLEYGEKLAADNKQLRETMNSATVYSRLRDGEYKHKLAKIEELELALRQEQQALMNAKTLLQQFAAYANRLRRDMKELMELCWNSIIMGPCVDVAIKEGISAACVGPRGVVIESKGQLLQLALLHLDAVLNTLTPREASVLRCRFNLCTRKHEHTLRAVGKRHRVSPERCRQIEAKALRKLRHPSRSKRLSQFTAQVFSAQMDDDLLWCGYDHPVAKLWREILGTEFPFYRWGGHELANHHPVEARRYDAAPHATQP